MFKVHVACFLLYVQVKHYDLRGFSMSLKYIYIYAALRIMAKRIEQAIKVSLQSVSPQFLVTTKKIVSFGNKCRGTFIILRNSIYPICQLEGHITGV